MVLVFSQYVLQIFNYLIFHQGRWGWIHIDFGHINFSPILPQDIFQQ